MKKTILSMLLAVMTVGLSAVFTACSSDDDNTPTSNVLTKTNIILHKGETSIVSNQESGQIKSENEYIASVTRQGVVTANHVGETKIVCGNEMCSVKVEAKYNLYSDPCLEFGTATKAHVKSMVKAQLIQENAKALLYKENEETAITYKFDADGKLDGVLVIFKHNNISSKATELANFMKERYEPISISSTSSYFKNSYDKDYNMVVCVDLQTPGYYGAAQILYMPLNGNSDDSNDPPTNNAKEVSFNLDYSFVESGSMTRSAGSDAYNDFYEKYVKTKILTPKAYDLTFTNSDGVTATFKGTWGENNIIRLTEGDWTVTGTSKPTTTCIDTLSLSFDEKITVTKDMSKVTLKAKNESYLLMFSTNYIQSVKYEGYYNYSTLIDDLKGKDGILYMFNETKCDVKIAVTNINGDTEKISYQKHNCPFEKGKYYYFENIDGGFDVPPMDEGL